MPDQSRLLRWIGVRPTALLLVGAFLIAAIAAGGRGGAPPEWSITAQRWCFLGSIDTWVFLGGPADLSGLVRKYAPRLGQEGFYDLL